MAKTRKAKKGMTNLTVVMPKYYSPGKRYYVINGVVYFSRQAALEAKGD